MSTLPVIPVFEYRGTPLDDDSMRAFCAMVFNKELECPLSDDPNICDIFLSKVALQRIRAYCLPFSVTNFFFAASLMTFVRNPAHVMGLLWVTHCHSVRTGLRTYDLNVWSSELFPMGTPSKEEFEKWWVSQKVTWETHFPEPDNMVDYPNLWPGLAASGNAFDNSIV